MASTTFVDNQTVIYASWLNDVNNAVYNGIFAASIITPSNIVCNGTVSGTGFTSLVANVLASPPAIGNAVPNTGAFTTLSATTLTLTNALSASYGGTGLTSPGTSGNVLTSNGSAWTSSAPTYFGIGQTWTDVTSSRLFGTTYTNSTGKPIALMVYAAAGSVSATELRISINGGSVFWFGLNTNSGGGVGAVGTIIIPVGATYNVTASTGTLSSWYELR